EGAEGMQAVMWSGLNRFTSKKWFAGQTIAGTFLKDMQYDCWLPHDPNYALICNVGPGIPPFDEAMQWAAQILSGVLPDPTLGATHYFSDRISAPAWAEGATFTVKIARQSFYKDVA